MNILETYQESAWIITYLKKHPRGGAICQGVSLDEIVRAIRLKRKDVYPVLDYLIKEGFIERPDKSNDGRFRLTHKGLVPLLWLEFREAASKINLFPSPYKLHNCFRVSIWANKESEVSHG